VAGGIFVSTVIGFFFAQMCWTAFLRPYRGSYKPSALPKGWKPISRSPFLIGFVLAMPFTLYQFWLFISPGLTKKEKRTSISLSPALRPFS
jgi:Sec-independent protein secretion pathway component TatC